jgi:restriction system protein
LIGALVERLGRDPDGDLIKAIQPAWYQVLKFLDTCPDELYKLSPREWEELIAASYDRAGFDEVILTPRSSDGGRDVIAVKHGHWSVRILDQVKASRPGRVVTADEVRSHIGVVTAD